MNGINGIFLGRMCPLHIGHDAVIDVMEEVCGHQNCLSLLGSSNAPVTIRNIFNNKERRMFFEKVHPNIELIDLPDYYDGNEWLHHLDMLIEESSLNKNNDNIFFGGCEQDVDFFLHANRDVRIINRFNGTTPRVSGTQIRDCLLTGRPIDQYVNPLIVQDIIDSFKQKNLMLL